MIYVSAQCGPSKSGQPGDSISSMRTSLLLDKSVHQGYMRDGSTSAMRTSVLLGKI